MLGAQEIEETFTGLFRSSEAYKSDETNETLITPAVPKMRINPAIARVNLRLVALATIVITLFAVLTCRASASSTFSYALTTTTDPARPGQMVQFELTASNLTNAAQYLSVGYLVPQFTTSINGYAAGTALTYTFGYIPAGVSQSIYLDFKVLNGTQAPPDGSLVNLVVSDPARSASVSRTAMVKSAPAALDLSTQQGSVAPGGSFSYTLAYHNASSSSLSGSQLSLPIPVGATFVSADGGGVKGTDGVVRWSPSALGAGATGEVHLSLKSSTTPAIQAALLIQAAWRNSSSQILAQASDAKAVYASPALSYALTTTDPVKPGQVVQFKLTASNLTNAAQYLSVGYHVPQFTTSINGYAAGTALSYTFGYIAEGTTEAVYLDFKVLSSTQNPPDGSLVTLEISNQASGASVSRTATVKSAPAAALDLSTQQGSVAPGGSFSYTLAYHNASSSSLSGSQLSLPIPVGATLVSADGGGVKGTDGVVRWSPSVLGAGATGEVHLSLKSSTTPAIQAALLIEAAWTNSSSQILARASDAKAVYASPAFSYGLTASGPAIPGHAIQFKLTVTNATNAAQYLSVGYHVPQFTTSTTGYAAGTALSYTFGNVAAGASQSVTLSFNVLSGTQTPPNGSLVTLVISDQARAVTVSRTSAINQTIALIDWTDSFSRNLVLIFQGEPLAFRYSPFSDLGQDSRTIVAGGVSGDCISL